MKKFSICQNIGKVRYLVSYHDGEKKHKDGSSFFDVRIFRNKIDLNNFKDNLLKQGYTQY